MSFPDEQDNLASHLRWYARQCCEDGSPLYGELLERAATDVEVGGPCWRLMSGHDGRVRALQLMGAVHRLVLTGQAPALARYYPSAGGRANPRDAWPAFQETIEDRYEDLRELVRRPVQTNEVGRCRALVGGFLLTSRATGLPLRLLEIGASAGLNLRWDQYRYETTTASWGEPSSPVRLVDGFVAGEPPLDVAARVVMRRGCDLDPVDVHSEEGRLTLLSYVWADQLQRLVILRGALETARTVPATVEKADAPEWLARQLSDVMPGVATVVFHSIVLGYLSSAGREQVRETVEEAGARATQAAPLAWLSMEPRERRAPHAEVRLTLWPGGTERLLATARFHGQSVHWLLPATEM